MDYDVIVVGNLSITAHILGGCHVGHSTANRVIDTTHQVFGYPGLYVVDGAALSANVEVNPALTIVALAERCMSLTPGKAEFKRARRRQHLQVAWRRPG